MIKQVLAMYRKCIERRSYFWNIPHDSDVECGAQNVYVSMVNMASSVQYQVLHPFLNVFQRKMSS